MRNAVPFSLLRQALVGLAFGPKGSNAWIEHGETPICLPWKDGEPVQLAVMLTNPDDEVQIVQPPLPLYPVVASGGGSPWGTGMEDGSRGAAVKDEEWFRCVKDSLELLSAILKRELPATFVATELLSKVGVRACAACPW